MAIYQTKIEREPLEKKTFKIKDCCSIYMFGSTPATPSKPSSHIKESNFDT